MRGYPLAFAAGAVVTAGLVSIILALITGDWRWLLVAGAAYLLVRRTCK